MKQRDNTLLMAALGAVGAGLAVRAVVRQRRATSFRNKVVLITGGSRGLGLLLARRVAAEGARVALCARDGDGLERARQDLVGRGTPEGNVFIHPCDVTDGAQIRATVEAVMRHFGEAVDVLINNAGIILVGPMDTMTEADYEEALRVHFWGPYHFVRAVLPGMRANRAGRIANVSSIGGLVRFPHLLPYATSKSALVGFSEGLRAELLQENIYVTTVCPGLTRTGSPPNAYFKGQNEKEYAWFALSDSLPGASMSADRAADQIVRAVRHGDAFLVTSWAAQAATLLHGVLPGVTDDLMGLVNRLLPSAEGGTGTERRTGRESESALAPSPLTALTEKAARDNNQEPQGSAGTSWEG